MNKDIKIALKSDHMDNNIVAKPAIVSSINKWTSMHWHDFYELEIILDGKGQVICNNKSHSVKPGMVSFLTPTDMHKYIIDSDISTICIQFTEDSLSKEILESFLNVKNNVIQLSDNELKRIISICELLINNTSDPSTEGVYKSKLLEALLISLKNEFVTTSTNYKISPQTMQKAISYINTHFRENPKMSDIANMLFLNEHYFCSLFKENTGVKYKDYLRKLKLNHAANLLKHTNRSITQISLDCGYTSQSNFNRDFKAFFGHPPSQYRKPHKKEEKN